MTPSFRPAGRLAGCLVALLLLGAAHAQELVLVDRPVAIVEEDVVLKSELDAAVRNNCRRKTCSKSRCWNA